MALTDYKITTADLNDKGVMGLPRVPGFSTAEMQRRFDEIAKENNHSYKDDTVIEAFMYNYNNDMIGNSYTLSPFTNSKRLKS